MSQSQRKSQLSLIPTVVEPDEDTFRDSRFAEAQFVTDEHGNKMVLAGGKLYPVQRPGGEIAELVNVDFFDKLSEVLIDRDIHGGQAAHAARTVARTQTDIEYSDAVLGGLKGGIAKWRYDVEVYHPQQKAARQVSAEMRLGVQDTQNAMIATVMGAMLEQKRRIMTDIFDIQDYNRDWGRYVSESLFEDQRTQQPVESTRAHERVMVGIANSHELSKIDREVERQLAIARLDAAQRAAERMDASLEGDKNRSFEVYRSTLGLTTDMTNAIAELRLIEQQQPTAQVTAAMDVLRATMDSMVAWGSSLDEETKKRMAPYIAKMAGDAINQAMRAARRG